MIKNCVKIMVTGMLILILMVGCGRNGNAINEHASDSEFATGEQESQSQPLDTASEEDMEKELAAYRAERENGESSLGDFTLAKLPSEDNYKYGVGDLGNTPEFDSRELNEAYKTANDYINGTLELESQAWECIDPRMLAIYEDEDKGVANGYDADNIFLCEYKDNGKWQYMILVREKKGYDWNVLYHGSSYKTGESDGGDK